MGEGLNGQTEGSGQSKIGDLEGACLVDEEVLRLEVAVNDSAGMAVVEPITELVEEQLHLVRSHGGLVLAHVLLQVVVDQLEDQIELLLGGDIEHLAEAGWMDGY